MSYSRGGAVRAWRFRNRAALAGLIAVVWSLSARTQAQFISAPAEGCLGDTICPTIYHENSWETNGCKVISPSGRVVFSGGAGSGCCYVADEPGIWTVSGDFKCTPEGAEDPLCPEEHERPIHAVQTEISCGSCCDGQQCSDRAATNRARTPGVDFRIDLGRRRDGRPAGSVVLRASKFVSVLYTPGALQAMGAGGDVFVCYDGPNLVSVCAPETTIGVAAVTSTSYELRVYGRADPEDCGTPEACGWESYTTAALRHTWLVERPTSNVLTLTKYEGNTSTGTPVLQYAYGATASSEVGNETDWTLTVTDMVAEEVIRYETTTWAEGEDPGTLVIQREIRPHDEADPDHVEIEVYQDFEFGRRLVERLIDPDHDALTTTWTYTDHMETDDENPAGLIASKTTTHGGTRTYQYSTDGVQTPLGLLTVETAPYGDGQTLTTTYTYEPNDEGDPVRYFRTSQTQSVASYVISQTNWDYTIISGPPFICRKTESRCTNLTDCGSSPLVTVFDYDTINEDRLLRATYPDGRVDVYTYEDGVFAYNSGDPLASSFTVTTGDDTRVTVEHWGTTASTPGPIEKQTTRDITVYSAGGAALLSRREAYDSGYDDELPLELSVYHRDTAGRLLEEYSADGTTIVHDVEFGCCGSGKVTYADGSTVETERDVLGRIATVTRSGVSAWTDTETGIAHAAQSALVTSYTYDSANRQTGRMVTGGTGGGVLSLSSSATFDLAGRVLSQTDEAGLETTWGYGTVDGGLEITVTRPGGATEITTHHPDGRVRSVSGTGVVHRAYTYEAQTGSLTTTEFIGTDDPGENAERFRRTRTDELGRLEYEERPAFDDETHPIRTTYSYDASTGQLAAVATTYDGDPVGAVTRYVYDDMGQQYLSGLDLDGGAGLDAGGGVDRVTESATGLEKLSSNWWQVTTTTVYDAACGSPSGVTTTQRRRLTGNSIAGTIGLSEYEDASGNVTITARAMDVSDHTVVEETTQPGSGIAARTASLNGRLVSSRSVTGVVTEYRYDVLGRRTHVVDPRSGSVVTVYNGGGQASSVTDAGGSVTTYAYYGPTDASAGRLKSVTNDLSKATYFAYTARGELARTWGAAAQPAEYGYDDYGQRTSLKTWRTPPASNGLWTDDEWPGSPGAADETTWTFDAATGLLTSKIYADATHVDYAYTADGRLRERTWARLDAYNDPLTTTYVYYGEDGFTPPGDYDNVPTLALGLIDYSDETPDVSYGYTQSGLLELVSDATGTREFEYDAVLQPIGEDLPDAFYGEDRDLTRLYSAGGGGEPPAGWPTGLEVGGGETPEYATGYHYDAASGRLERVTGPGLPGGGTEPGVKYSFLADSDLVEKAEYRSGGDVILRTTRLIEDHRDLVDSVENKWVGSSGNTVVSKYDYTNDDIGRRTAGTRTGAAFATTQPVAWAYNDRNELVDETRGDAGLTGEQLAKLHVAYRYDAIGNRTFEPAGEQRFVRVEGDLGDDEVPSGDDNPPHDEPAASTYYNANALNQYERVERPYVPSEYDAVFPAFSQRLTYDADGNLSLVEKFGDANCDNLVNNFDIDDFVLAILHPNATDDVGESPPYQLAPPTGYTGDDTCWNQRRVWGDITGDGSLDNFDIDPFADVLLSSHEPVVCYKRFVWDAENRLVAVQPMSTPTENGVERFVYVYDYLGRRVEKRKELWSTSGGGHWATDSTIRLVYDGWNVIEILDATGEGDPVVIRKQTWGLDLSGQSGSASVAGLHGAGGIGGLLAVYDTNGTTTGENPTADDKSYAYLYDANGNVGQCIEWETGFGGASSDEWHSDRFGARYEYDPYGNIIGPDADHDGDIAEEAGPYAVTNVHRFSTKRQDAETGWIDAGHRLLIPPLGRWANHDPVEERGGMNVYAYVNNRPAFTIDPFGLNLYAIDGTWASSGQGTNTEWIYRLTDELKYYWDGPSYGLTGMDSVGIARGVHDQICKDLQKANDKCRTTPINLVGWSRGGSIAIWVAHKLHREGCSVGGSQIYPSVNWLGLFDAVDQCPGIPNWAMTSPPNVLAVSHAVKTSASAWEWTKFPTAAVSPQTPFWRKDGSPTSHGDVGASMFNNNAFFWMRSQAKAAGVKIN